MKELARAKKLDTDASQGKPGVALGAQHAQGGSQEQGLPCFGSWTESPATEVNAFNRRWKKPGKGAKGGKGDKAGKGDKGGGK